VLELVRLGCGRVLLYETRTGLRRYGNLVLREDADAKRGRLDSIVLLVSFGVRARREALELKGLRCRVPDEARQATRVPSRRPEYLKVRLAW